MFFYSYYLSVTVSGEQNNIKKYFNKSKEIININYLFWKDCQFCNSKKFIRSSHCRTCQQCILFRDHHCPYTANCIGYKNIQYFLNFLFWGMYSIVYYNISCIKFFIKKDNINLNDGRIMPRYVKISIIIDFIVNILFFNGLLFLFLRTILIVYENYSTYEKDRFLNIERHYFCCNINRNANDFCYNNNWNIGFLSHLYYGIGPTILHSIFPIYKFKNYPLDENCCIFRKWKLPDTIEVLKVTMKIKNVDVFY